MQHGCVQIGGAAPVLDSAVAEVVGGPVNLSALDASSRQPDAKSIGMMVAAVFILCARSAAEFPTPKDQGGIEKAPEFQIIEQTGGRKVGLLAAVARGHGIVAVSVPGLPCMKI